MDPFVIDWTGIDEKYVWSMVDEEGAVSVGTGYKDEFSLSPRLYIGIRGTWKWSGGYSQMYLPERKVNMRGLDCRNSLRHR